MYPPLWNPELGDKTIKCPDPSVMKPKKFNVFCLLGTLKYSQKLSKYTFEYLINNVVFFQILDSPSNSAILAPSTCSVFIYSGLWSYLQGNKVEVESLTRTKIKYQDHSQCTKSTKTEKKFEFFDTLYFCQTEKKLSINYAIQGIITKIFRKISCEDNSVTSITYQEITNFDQNVFYWNPTWLDHWAQEFLRKLSSLKSDGFLFLQHIFRCFLKFHLEIVEKYRWQIGAKYFKESNV